MDIFKKVSESAKSIGESAKSISKNTIETTKMRMEISKLEKEMENNINALGNLVYLQYKGDPKSLEADITALKQQLAPVCVKCNAELPPNAKFCSNCGVPVSKTPEPPEVDETPSEE